jgi:hypothetical protein
MESGADETACLAALRYALENRTEPSDIAVRLQAVNKAWDLISSGKPGVAAGATAFLAREGQITVRTVWESWDKQDAAWREKADATIEKWFARHGDLLKQTDRWSETDETLRPALTKAIASKDAATKRLGLWLLAELPLDLESIDDTAVRQALRDADVFNRRNAARILRRQAAAP